MPITPPAWAPSPGLARVLFGKDHAMRIYARQGDLVIEKIDGIDGDLESITNFVFAGDSSGHHHTLIGTAQIRRDGAATLVRLSQALRLEHGKPDGHETVTLEIGTYRVRPLRERGDAGDRAVED
jgi:hypothetical protein